MPPQDNCKRNAKSKVDTSILDWENNQEDIKSYKTFFYEDHLFVIHVNLHYKNS